MTFKATVSVDGHLLLGDAATQAGFAPGRVVEVIVTRSGSLILALDNAPALDVSFKPISRRSGRWVLADGGAS